MAAKLLPPLKPEDVHLNAAQAAAVPKYEPFPGELLSKDGLLQTSSACQYDRPLSYAQVLSGGFGGYFDTNNEEKPWAQVQLPGEAELSGIVLLQPLRIRADAGRIPVGRAAQSIRLARRQGLDRSGHV